MPIQNIRRWNLETLETVGCFWGLSSLNFRDSRSKLAILISLWGPSFRWLSCGSLLAKDFTEDDCIGSPYAVHEYLCNPTLGTEELELWAGVMTFLQIWSDFEDLCRAVSVGLQWQRLSTWSSTPLRLPLSVWAMWVWFNTGVCLNHPKPFI